VPTYTIVYFPVRGRAAYQVPGRSSYPVPVQCHPDTPGPLPCTIREGPAGGGPGGLGE
uniref:Uncharacterized protein n=1 Tax=Ursus americanus TaxID=9643 RepID=A0A452QAT0_URSAM